MEFDYYSGAAYADDDHHIDLRHPHFRREPFHHYTNLHNADIFAHQGQHANFAHHLAGLAVDVKPRLTKEQHDILESHYQRQNKPNTQTKKSFAEGLGVSLDKVNNWFQNRRAKSKQDAKKATVGTVQPVQQPGSQQNFSLSSEDVSAQFLSSEYFNNHNDSAIGVDPVSLSNALGISQPDLSPQETAVPSTTMSPQDLINRSPQRNAMPNEELETHRRTLTQEQFDTLAHTGDYVAPRSTTANTKESPMPESSNESLLNEYFPELGDLEFEHNLEHDFPAAAEMQPAFSTGSYGTADSTFSEAPSASTLGSTADVAQRNASTFSSLSDWSEESTPSLSFTPANHHTDSVFEVDETEISPRGKVSTGSSGSWQPGQSVPVDLQQMEREFREAAIRSATQSVGHSRSNSSHQFAESPASYQEQPFPSGETTSSALTQSMDNMAIGSQRRPLRTQTSMSSMSGAGSIAARRQRPKPQPLSSSSLRSASYCGALPTAPNMPVNSSSNLAPTAPTLRRIKSSNVMNGIASGRIQKNIGGQRSPMHFSFADAMNSPKFARRVSSYSPAGQGVAPGSANLAPPTPLSPNELSTRLDIQRQLQQLQAQQSQSIQHGFSESIDEHSAHMYQSNGLGANTFSSPPTTPLYPPHFARARLGMLNENTPPQSAPATQQCFPGSMFSQAPQMQSSMSQAPMMSSQGQSFMPMMANEYPQMPNVVMPSQHMQSGSYLDMLAAQQYSGMGHVMQPPQSIQMNYGGMQYGNNLGAHNITPPNVLAQYPFVPSSSGVLLSQQGMAQQSKNVPAADFHVHEYSPPEMKHAITPRKTVDSGPKSYTFANHGPEHFEKGKKDASSSPASSNSGSSS